MMPRLMGLTLVALLTAVQIVGTTACVASQGSPDPVAARVNGREIPVRQVQQAVDLLLSRYRKYGASSAETAQRLYRQELERQIDMELLVQAAERDLNDTLEGKLAERMDALPAMEESDQEVQRRQLRRTLLVEEYLTRQGVEEVRVPEADMQQYYSLNRSSFVLPETVTASHILFRLPRQSEAAEIAASTNKMASIREEILAGGNFAEAAQRYSECASALSGGDLGAISRGYMPEAFDAVAFQLRKGELSSPIRTRHGVHLILVRGKTNARIRDYDEVQPLIEKLLLKRVREQRIEQISASLRKDAQIERLPSD